MSILPISLTAYKEALKSHARVKAYLNSPEATSLLLCDNVDDTLVDIQNASFSWNECSTEVINNEVNESLVIDTADNTNAVLQNVTLQIKKGEFIALVGEVGSGKVSCSV